MPSQDAKRAADQGRRLSRRSLLQGAATAGAAGLAVSAIGTAASPAFAATTSRPAGSEGAATKAPSSAGSAADGSAAAPAGAIMVHVRDAKSGDIEVFSGTSKTRLRDKDLAARIARVIS